MKKIALITGASRGIGAATARHFAQQGYTVIINYNNSADKAKALQTELLQCGYDAHLYQADVSNPQQVADMFNYVAKYFRHLDVLVNNAGVWRGGLVQDVSLDDY
ncbi:MAG: SDR family NAD(P)-dependent oxidoreductase, partial [Clostridia bacterium]|nr:SDR family NAD(P)-dependent oxidoreductase [Clostridia bacterium]